MIKAVYYGSMILLIANIVLSIFSFGTINLIVFISQAFVFFALVVISRNAIQNEGIREELRGFRDYYYESIKEKK